MYWNASVSVAERARHRRPSRGRFLAATLVLLNACAMAEPPATAPDPASLPEGAIPVGQDLYMLPMGEDEAGCPVFQPWSPTLMVVQALHWRAADGGFTLDRSAADCPPLPDDG